MANFAASDLVAAAKLRFGETVLRERMRGAATADAQDLELKKIAAGVINRAQDALDDTIGWPLPGTWPSGSSDPGGTDISGKGYAEVWPQNLLQKALDLFNWRTISGLDAVSDNQRKVGLAAEEWFDDLEAGVVGLGIGVSTELSTRAPVAARDRDGASLIGGCDRENILDTFNGRIWRG